MSTEPRRMNDHGFFDDRATEVENLRATVSTLLGRIEALERTVSAMREREQSVRRAVGQLASACDIVRK